MNSMEASHNETTVPENVAIQSHSIQCSCIYQPSKSEESKTEKYFQSKALLLGGEIKMKAFDFDDHLVSTYERFSRSFTAIRSNDLRDEIDAQCDAGRFRWSRFLGVPPATRWRATLSDGPKRPPWNPTSSVSWHYCSSGPRPSGRRGGSHPCADGRPDSGSASNGTLPGYTPRACRCPLDTPVV